MSKPAKRLYGFGPFTIDAAEGLLLRDGEIVPLTPKAFDTLLALVENSGHVISKDELMQMVWPDSFVEENNLSQNISMLRKALHDGSSDGSKYIETVPKRGYRFKVNVTERRRETPPPPDLIIRELTRTRVRIEETTPDTFPGPEESVRHASPKLLPSPSARGYEIVRAQGESVPFRVPEVKYAQSGDVNIAYQVVGDGPIDLVFVMGWVSHLEYFWAEPSFARFLRRLASFARLILFDKRGTGLSDRVPVTELPTLEQRMDDVRAVMDAVGSERAALCGVSEGGPMCALFAATYPEKIEALVMIGTYAKRIWDPDYPWAPPLEEREQFYDELQKSWGGPVGLEERAPSVADDPNFREWWATYLRMGASPGAALALTKMNADIDVRHVLPTIRVPSLIIHRTGDHCLKIEEGRYVAGKIPGARLIELPGEDHLPFVGDQDAILDEIEEFITGTRHVAEPDRMLATVLFMNVDESSLLENNALERLRSRVKNEIQWYRGREMDSDADGLLAIFDGPARAIRCACAINEAAKRIGLEVKIGLHTGECDVVENSVNGTAVKIGEQVAANALAGEILVSSTVKDLVAGSGIQFKERGSYVMETIAEEWRLFSVVGKSCKPS